MYLGKRGELVTLVVIGMLILASGIFFISQINNGNSITGAAIGLTETILEENNSEELVENILNENIEEEILDKQNEIEVSEGVGVQANCISWPCNCGDIITVSTITMNSSLGPCNFLHGLILGRDDVTIDCQNNGIIGGASSLDGIYVGGYDNITIKNCNITNFDNGISTQGGAEGCLFQNNTITGNTLAVKLVTSHLNTIDNNTLSGSTTYEIYIDSGDYNNITNNYIANTDTTRGGIYLYGNKGSDGGHIYNNVINNTVYYANEFSDDVHVYNNIFSNVNITDQGLNFWNQSLDCNNANILNGKCSGGNYFSDHIGTDTDDNGILNGYTYAIAGNGSNVDYLPLLTPYLFYGPADGIFDINSTFNSINLMVNNSYHSTRQNITFYNASSGLSYLVGDTYFNNTANFSATEIFFNDSAMSVREFPTSGVNPAHIIYLNNKSANNQDGVIICPGAGVLSQVSKTCTNAINFTYQNVTDGVYIDGVKVTIEGNAYKIENVTGTGATYNPYSNLTIWDETDAGMPYGDQEKQAGEQVKFFANYTSSSGRNITGANCTIYYHDATNDLMAYNTTNALYEANRSYSTNGILDWNVTCSKLYYDSVTATDDVNITGLSCGDTILQNTTLTENINGAGTCLTIGDDDITLDCAGYSINGTGSGNGIDVTARGNIVIKNCNVDGFENNIYVAATDQSSFINNTLTSASQYGIYVIASSNNNIIENNTFNGNSDGIIVQSSNFVNITNNIFINNAINELVLTAADNNIIRSNTFSNVISSHSIHLYTTSEQNTLVNNTITVGGDWFSVNDETSASYRNYLIYNNSNAQISWNLTNLTTAINLSIGNTIFLESNNLGLVDDANALNLNGSAQITFYGLSSDHSHNLLKNGIRCDQTDSCNITSDTSGTLIADVASFSNYTTEDRLQCGDTITADTTLTENLTGTGDCIILGVNDITLDCAGYSITGDGGSGDYGVYATTKNNVTVKNCYVNTFSHGIFFNSVTNSTVYNNTAINNTGGITTRSSSSINITGNNLFNNIDTGIYFFISTNNNLVENNYLFNNSRGISLGTGTHTISNNNITSNAEGIEITSSTSTLYNNSFTNNTLSISDESLSYYNQLIYNNSFGQITWNSTNITFANDLALDTNLYIANNTLAFNSSAITGLNKSATISFYGTNVSTLRSVVKNVNYETDRNNILSTQRSCLYDTCTLQSSAGGNVVFNVSSLSSFTASEDVYCGNIGIDSNMTINLNAGTGTCFTFSNDNITLDCSGQIINGTMAGVAVHALNKNNLTVKNCVFQTLFRGLQLINVNDSNYFNNTFVNNPGYGVYTQNNNYNSFYNSNFTNNNYGITLDVTSNHNNISDNTVHNSSTVGISISGTNNTFVNNNFTLNLKSFNDASYSNNSLIYSNNFGQIYWPIISNLTIVDDLSIGSGILIGNNSVAVNSTGYLNLNTSADVTFYGLNGTGYNQLIKWSNFTDNSTEIISNGVVCDSCFLSSYDNTTGTLLFTTDAFSSISAYNDPGEQCGFINSDKTLTDNIVANSTCFTFNADNLVLDCAGYSITGDGVGTDYGVYALGRDNITVKNCTLVNFYSGIYFRLTDNSNVTLNNATSNNYGYYISSGQNNILTNNYGYGGAVRNYYLFLSTNNTLENNWDYNSEIAFRIYNSNNNNLINNTITNASKALTINGGNNNIIKDNNLLNYTTYGINIESSVSEQNNQFINNNLSGTGITFYDEYIGTYDQIIYNNSFGEITWNSTNLTSNINLSIGSNIILEDNNIGLVDDANALSLNGTATIKIHGLTFDTTPHLNKSGVGICDWNNTCNISSYESGTLTAIVASFSNYTASNNTAPNLTSLFITNEPIYTNTSFVYANATAIDPENDPLTYNVSWYVNNVNVKNETRSGIGSGNEIIFNLSDTDSNYNKSNIINISIIVFDNLLLNDSNSNVTTVQNLAPYINPEPSNTTINTPQEWYYDANVTDPDIDDGVDTAVWGDNTTLFDINMSTGIINFTPSEAQAGVYSIEINVTDGTATNTSAFFLTVNDVEVPRVTIESPTATNYTTNTSLELNYTVVEANIDSCWYNLDAGTNTTLAGCTNTTFNTSSGTQTLYLYANDTSGNLNSTSVTFTVDLAPNITSLSLIPSPAYTNDTMNASVLFSGDGVTTELVYFNWTVEGTQVQFSSVAASNGETVSTTLANTYYNKTHNVSVYVWGGDALSNSSILSTSINISNAPPYSLQNFNDTSGTTGDSFSYNLSLYFNDTDLDEINYTGANVTNVVITINNTDKSATIYSGTAGTYELYFNATDNTNTTQGNSFNITWTDAAVVTPPSGGGGGGTPSYDCISDDDCEDKVEKYCLAGKVYKNKTFYVCENPRSTRSKCVISHSETEFDETCPFGCNAGVCLDKGEKVSGGVSCPPGKELINGECVEIVGGDPEVQNYNNLEKLFQVVYPTSYIQKVPEDEKSCLKSQLNPILKLSDKTYHHAMEIFNSANSDVSVIHELNGDYLKLLWIVKESSSNTYCTELDIYPVKEDRNNDYFWSIGNVLTEGTTLASEYICFKTEGVPTLITQDFVLCGEIMDRNFEIKESVDSLN